MTRKRKRYSSSQILNHMFGILAINVALNMAKSVEIPTIPCFAHTLQLAVDGGVLSQGAVIDVLVF